MSQSPRKPTANDQALASDPASGHHEPSYYDDGLLSVAGPIMMIAYGSLFVIAMVTFSGAKISFFVASLSAAFAVFFFAIPLLMMRIRSGRDERWTHDKDRARSAEVEVSTGTLHRWEAIVQIVSIPLTILAAFATLAIRWSAL